MGGTAQIVQGELVSGNYFEQLRVRPQLGRPIVASDDAMGAAPVALLSAPFWQRAYGGNAGALGQTIKVNMVPVTIIGVAPRGFTGAKNVLAAPDLFFPMSAQPLVEPRGKGGSLIGQSSPEMWWLNIMGRAKPGVPDAQAPVSYTHLGRSHNPRFTGLHFWQKRYYDFNIRNQRQFAKKLRYIHCNPVKRGLCERRDDWEWSSFRQYAMGIEGRVEIESE